MAPVRSGAEPHRTDDHATAPAPIIRTAVVAVPAGGRAVISVARHPTRRRRRASTAIAIAVAIRPWPELRLNYTGIPQQRSSHGQRSGIGAANPGGQQQRSSQSRLDHPVVLLSLFDVSPKAQSSPKGFIELRLNFVDARLRPAQEKSPGPHNRKKRHIGLRRHAPGVFLRCASSVNIIALKGLCSAADLSPKLATRSAATKQHRRYAQRRASRRCRDVERRVSRRRSIYPRRLASHPIMMPLNTSGCSTFGKCRASAMS